MRKKVLLFDLFGTLVGIKSKTKPYLKLAQHLNYDEITTTNLINDVITNNYFHLPDYIKISSSAHNEFLNNLDVELKSISYLDGIKNMLEILDKNNLYLISNISTPYKNYVKEVLCMEKYFNKTFFSCDHGMRKPDVNFFNLIIDEIGCDKNDIIMIGDSYKSDIIGAKNAGIKSILKHSEITTYILLNKISNGEY